MADCRLVLVDHGWCLSEKRMFSAGTIFHSDKLTSTGKLVKEEQFSACSRSWIVTKNVRTGGIK